MANTALWDALGKTDPNHTKGFNRAGGFKGTAIKPIWILRKLTEQFGPAGQGWGVNEPTFQVVPAEGEILVYCTVSCWHGDRQNLLWGVGGDKVQAKRSSGAFNDDEAFKKAFTDAVNNAFKSIGVGADVHMGLFDDDKYVTAMRQEFAEPEPVPHSVTMMLNGIDQCTSLDGLKSFFEQHWKAIPMEHRRQVIAKKEERKAGLEVLAKATAG
jgi:hypothetical protein